MKTLHNFIGGDFLAPRAGRYLANLNPATGETYAELPDSDADDIRAAVDAAYASRQIWRETAPAKRAAYLLKIAARIRERGQDLARAESIDQGKPLWLAESMDIPRAASNFEFFAGAMLHHENRSTSDDPASLNYTLRSPVGVAGLISPWNLPLYLLTWKIAPALAMGNTVVAKPSELTPMTAYLLAEIVQEVGLPPGVCNIVFGTGQRTGVPLVCEERVPLISFTGSTATGEEIMRASAPGFKKLSLELGGKNPSLIFADADWQAAMPTLIRSSFLNQGEICLCGSRIFVAKAIYEPFRAAFVAATQELRVGPPLASETFIGALISAAHRDKVLGAISLAREWGGRIESGGRIPTLPKPYDAGFFCEPTVITGLSSDCPVMQEEVFGPLVTITPFADEDEAIELANQVRYGLAATVWTSQLKRAHRVAARLEAGQIWVNTWMRRDLRTPFGGIKASGLGREGGAYSLEFYSEEKNVCIALD